jgi:hypothetical protein
MATWTTIPDSSLEPGKPIRSIDALALRDNPVAIAEGEVGATRIMGRAAKRLQDYSVLTVTASDAFLVGLGINSEAGTTSTSSTANPPTVVARRYTIELYTGVMRFRLSHSGTDGLTSRLNVYKNNTLIQAYTTNSTTLVERTNDISIVPGDVIEWRHSTTGTAYPSNTQSPSVRASDAYTTISFYISQSDV